MNTEYLLNQILISGTKMRRYQKEYYEARSPEFKRELLQKAKTAEREFDKLLAEVRTITGVPERKG